MKSSIIGITVTTKMTSWVSTIKNWELTKHGIIGKSESTEAASLFISFKDCEKIELQKGNLYR